MKSSSASWTQVRHACACVRTNMHTKNHTNGVLMTEAKARKSCQSLCQGFSFRTLFPPLSWVPEVYGGGNWKASLKSDVVGAITVGAMYVPPISPSEITWETNPLNSPNSTQQTQPTQPTQPTQHTKHTKHTKHINNDRHAEKQTSKRIRPSLPT